MRTGSVVSLPVAHFLKVFVEHARITDEAHLFGFFDGINANGSSAPSALNLKGVPLISLFIKWVHDYFLELSVTANARLNGVLNENDRTDLTALHQLAFRYQFHQTNDQN